MTKYAMADWLRIHNETRGHGTTYVTGANLNKDLTIHYLEVTTDITGTLTSYGGLTAGNVKGIEGSKQFVLEGDGTISLVVGCEDKIKSFVKIPDLAFEHKVVVPMAKWVEDMKFHQKKVHTRDEDWYRSVEVVGCEVKGDGTIKAINATITYDHDYGPFGPNKSDHKVRADDLLLFTYGMHRNDICDDWRGRYRNEYKDCKCYFDEDFNLVFEDDGLYHILIPENYAKVA